MRIFQKPQKWNKKTEVEQKNGNIICNYLFGFSLHTTYSNAVQSIDPFLAVPVFPRFKIAMNVRILISDLAS